MSALAQIPGARQAAQYLAHRCPCPNQAGLHQDVEVMHIFFHLSHMQNLHWQMTENPKVLCLADQECAMLTWVHATAMEQRGTFQQPLVLLQVRTLVQFVNISLQNYFTDDFSMLSSNDHS